MNYLFLVLPVVIYDNNEAELVCLKTSKSYAKATDFTDFLKFISKEFEWIKDENYYLYYDQKRLKDLYNDCKKEVDKLRPSPILLLKTIENLNPIDKDIQPIKVNGVGLSYGVVCYYVNHSNDGSCVLVDLGYLLNISHTPLFDNRNEIVNCNVIRCNRNELINWFAKNRNPARQLDTRYLKHGKQEKHIDGERISPCSYEEEDCVKMLAWAVGSKKKKRKYFVDREKNRLVVFMDEGLKMPTFHCYDVDDDNKEKEKMKNECDDKVLMSKIELISNHIRIKR